MPPTHQQLSAVPASSVPKSKRKSAPREDEDDSGSESSGSDVSMINVDFDFYGLNPDVDQIAVKRLLRQTLSHDDEIIDVHPLAELILGESSRLGVGSSVKTDGEESDPWALLTAISANENRNKSSLKPFLDYLSSVTPSSSPIHSHLSSSSAHTAMIFSLRMLNLPLPLVPPLYKMMLSELEEGHSPEFSHFILWARGYRLEGTEQESGLGMDRPNGQGKKKSKKTGPGMTNTPLASGSFPYHAEEEYIDKYATSIHTYPFKSAPKRDEDAFGVEQFGKLILIEKAKLAQAVQEMEEAAR